MQLRVLFSIVNIAVFLVLFALEFVIPRYATYLFYLLLAWFVVSFLILRMRFMSRPVGGRTLTPTAGPPTPGTPLPSSTGPGATGVDGAEIGFCPHCGTHIAPGTLFCPSCGRPTRIG